MALNDIEEQVAKLLEEFSKSLGEANLRWGGFEKSIEALKLSMNAASKGTKDLYQDEQAYKRVMLERKKREQEILQAQRSGTLTYRETQAELKKLNAEVGAVIPPQFKQNFETYTSKQSILNSIVTDTNDLLVRYNLGLKVGGQVLGSLGGAAAKIFSAYQSGQNDIEMAGTTTAAAASAFFGATGGIGKALSGIGEAAMGTAPLLAETGPFALGVAGVGLALTVLGNILDRGSEQANKLAQTAIPILTKEVSKLYESFNSISSTGAIFSNGIKGMNDAALGVNLTLPEFADVLKQNSGNLAALGISTTEAAKRMGEVGTTMRRTGVSMELQRLGFTFKEQAGLIADTMGLMRQSGGSLTSSNAEVAQQTAKYAENLRIISAITGEDAKKKEQQVRDQSNELAFQQKLAGMDEKTRLNTIAAMENMSDAQRKAFMETVVFGQAITPASAYAVANIQGFGDSVNRAVKEFYDNTLSAESMQKNNAEFGSMIKTSLLGAVDLARAGMVSGISGFVTDLKGLYQNELQFRNVFTKEAVDAAREAVKEQGKAQTDLSDGMIRAANAGKQMALTIQQAVLESGVLETFAGTIADITEKIANTIKEFTGSARSTGAFSSLGITNTQQQNLITAAQQGRQANLGLFEGGSLRNTLAGMNEEQLTAMAREANTSLENLAIAAGFRSLDDFRRSQQAVAYEQQYNSENLPQFDGGGLASGPAGGYLARLHGTEAVLPENLTNMLTEAAAKAQLMNEQLPMSTVRPDRSEDLLASINSKFDIMIDLLDDINGHTERTSVRVA